MKNFIIDYPVTIDTKELSSQWLERTFNISGDAMVAVQGPCTMLYPGPSTNDTPIPQVQTISFVAEHFHIANRELVAYHRMLSDVILDTLAAPIEQDELDFWLEDYRLSQSILKDGWMSSLIYIGFYLESDPTYPHIHGLDNLVGPIDDIALRIMQTYCKKIIDIGHILNSGHIQ